MSRLSIAAVIALTVAVLLLTCCNCPPRPEPSTTGGGNTYGTSVRRTRNVDEGWNPPPAPRLDRLEEAGSEPDEELMTAESEPNPEGLAESAPPFVPRGASVKNGKSLESDSPVRVQLGPRPVVLEAGRLTSGDELVLVITDTETEKVVLEREFAILRTAARSTSKVDVAVSADDWDPEPGRYIVEILQDDAVIASEELSVPE